MSTNEGEQVHAAVVYLLFKRLKSEGKTIKNHQLQTNAIGIGNNFCSGISKLRVEYEQNGVTVKKSFLLKIPCLSNFYKELSKHNMFHNEKLMYSIILPAMHELLDCQIRAKSYLPADNENLVLDDLNEYGYEMMDKKMQLDLDHCVAALISLARFHALSIKLYETCDGMVDLIKVACKETEPDLSLPKSLFDKFNNTLDLVALPDHVREKLKRFRDNHIPDAFNETMVPSDGYNVLLHGDFWMGNILFKHDEKNRVVDAKLVDYQMVHRGSPVIDLIEFFVTSVRFEIYQRNRDVMIERYLETFNEVLDSLNSCSWYTKDELMADLRRYKRFFVYTLGAYLPIVLHDTEDPFNCGSSNHNVYTSELYLNVLPKWALHLEDEGYL